MKYAAADVLAEAKRLEGVLRDLRRDFHQHPEGGFHEVWTTNRIKEVLGGIEGVEILPHKPATGVVAELKGEKPEKGTIGLRCDIDAIDIQEKNTHSYVSLNPGYMHACGHDGHIVTVLGAAMLLSRFRPDCNVRFLFQPAEETLPDGAPEFIAAGALDGLREVWGFHLNATSDFGKIGWYDGAVMAGGQAYTVTVTGKSGHPAYPEACVNPIDVLSRIAVQISGIKSTIRGTRPYLLTPCSINCGKPFTSAIPASGTLAMRTCFLEEELRDHIRRKVEEVTAAFCTMYGASYEIEVTDLLPLTYNTESMGETVRKHAAEFGFETEEIFPSMGSDDFGYYKAKAPSYYMTFGIRKGADFPLAHTPIFDFDEAILPISAAQFASCALRNE